MSDEKPKGKDTTEARENPTGHLGAEEVVTENNKPTADSQTTPVTAPEIVHDKSRTEKETLDEFKEDMTGG